MSHKAIVIELFEAGKDYDEIQEATGAKRSYIRTIISKYKKTLDAGNVGDQAGEQEEEKPEVISNDKDDQAVKDENKEMHFKNDLDGADADGGDNMGDQKTGAQYHKAWVDAKAFECACGCTLNRKSKFCPNCGVTLDWSGF